MKNNVMNRYVLLLFVLFTLNLNAQSWKKSSGGNAFDGKYKSAFVVGKGTDYPYNKPLLVINVYNENSLNFFISSAGYFQSESDIDIYWIFSNEPNTIYSTEDFTISDDKKTIFLQSFEDPKGDFYMRMDFIKKLKSASKVDVRIKDKYGKNDISFKLNGSTNAINYVISKRYLDKLKEFDKMIEELKLEAEKKIEKENHKNAQGIARIGKLLKKYNLSETEEKELIRELEIKSIFKDDLEIYDIDSLEIKVTKHTADIEIYNSEKKIIDTYFFIEKITPEYVGRIRDQIIENEKRENGKRFKNNVKHISNFLIHDGISEQELQKIVSFFNSDYIVKEKLLHDVVDTLNVFLPSKDSKEPKLILYDIHDFRIHSLGNLNTLAPNYVEKLKNQHNKECKRIFYNSLYQFNLTDEERELINPKLNKIEYFNFDPSSIKKGQIDFPDYDNRTSILSLIDFSNKKVFSLHIFHKSFRRKMMKRINN